MTPRGLHVLGAALGAVLLIGAAGSPLRAQALPASADVDLTVPPDMRNGAPPPMTLRQAPRTKSARDSAHGHRGASGGGNADARTTRATPEGRRPVEVGVTMRGGSGTSRVYAPTGASEAIRESGSAFGAGMRFGF